MVSSGLMKYSFSFDLIANRGYNENTGIRSCSGDLNFTMINIEKEKEQTVKVPLTYDIVPTDDGNSFFVEIWGLEDF